MFLENCVSRGNKRNYRLWSKGKLSSCHSEDPKWRGGTGGAAHFSFHGAAGRFVIDRPIVRAGADNAAPVFLIETSIPLTLAILNPDIDAPAARSAARRVGKEGGSTCRSWGWRCIEKKKNNNVNTN